MEERESAGSVGRNADPVGTPRSHHHRRHPRGRRVVRRRPL